MSKQSTTVGRFLQCLAIGGPGAAGAAFASAQNWIDRDLIAYAAKAAISAIDTDDYPAALQPVADAFLGAMRAHSISLRLIERLRRVPLLTRVYVSASTGQAIEVSEGQPIPVLSGDWSATTLAPRKFAGISVQTLELVRSANAVASAAIGDDLARAVAEAENTAFASPDVAGSVLDGAPSIASTGTTDEAISADLRDLFGMVRGDGTGALALVMHEQTAAHIHFSDPSKFPLIGPQGGSVAGTPVLISNEAVRLAGSPTERAICLVDASQIFWADRGRVELSTTREAALQLDTEPTAGATNVVSMLQTDSVATKALRESSWYARAGASAFLRVPY